MIALALVLTVVLAGLGYTVSRGHTPSIAGPNSIASLETVTLGGVTQWVLIRGADRSKPIVLFLHGGPGAPLMYLAHDFQRELERDFVVVQWDRAGAGKSLPTTPPAAMSVSQQLADTVELTNLLRGRFGQAKIYLVGHSWGTYLGMLTIAAHPELYYAYIGVGQVADSTQTRAVQRGFLLDQATRRNDATVLATLAKSDDTIDYESMLFAYGGELYHSTSFLPLVLTGLRAQEYTLLDAFSVRTGPQFSAKYMRYDVISGELMSAVARVDVPTYFFVGRHDYTVPWQLTEAYFSQLQTPAKRLVWFEDSAHFAFWEQPSKFAAELRVVVAETLHR